ncbi:N-acetyl-glucosamine-6-phosphate deacetylase [Coemansia thaxteri]|uniref:N-acetylglucosamine-6-phosphate deacetylase n=1 Tax=Coemansia thaxteri TaxID=2663907 RepID=A0A9W8BBW1_9FUNG|nr:N-acetyl-glucosamine-6-phosphate deacetylase [Coemansia thaxteri]KAJ2001844.1 N-acetyl-glucosamine-6-phosphate deacetylase [Coemansia thaxteri]KAJ2472946.1 N-acetyl-glucosamine-6-phosphate deacetylase [Coemansia sp. RSA 2322]KAJ2484552.1 N-acetyl-glucosamine-6-phosphate deacetylase [Coemansia sp. RSA 2320]
MAVINSVAADAHSRPAISLEAIKIVTGMAAISVSAPARAVVQDPSMQPPTSPGKDGAPSSRRLFSLPDPPSGLASPSTSPTRLVRMLSARSIEQQAIIAGGPITQIHNCRVLRNHKIESDDIWFQDGRIINPTSLYGLRSPDARIDARGLIVAPGLIDVQLNGAFGYDFSFNQSDIDTCLNVVSRGVLLQGCTSFCPTTVSSMSETYHGVLPHLGKRPGSLKNGAESLGAHVEGPFMNPKKKGAHEVACLRTAANGLADFDECYGLDNLRNYVAYMTVAPEVDGVLEAIPQLISKCQIGISLGHSVATNEVARQAHEGGAKMVTHLFNAMTDFHHRDPGIVGLLSMPSSSECVKLDANGVNVQQHASTGASTVFYGLICDGIHVHPNAVKIAYNSHPTGAILVTDAMGAMGLPDGQYKLGNMSVDVGPKSDTKGNPRAAVIQGTNTLAGSIVTLIECVRNFKEFTQCSTVEALEAATLRPAQMLGIAHRKGTLDFGADADMIFLSDDLDIQHIFVRGELATPATVGLDFHGSI